MYMDTELSTELQNMAGGGVAVEEKPIEAVLGGSNQVGDDGSVQGSVQEKSIDNLTAQNTEDSNGGSIDNSTAQTENNNDGGSRDNSQEITEEKQNKDLENSQDSQKQEERIRKLKQSETQTQDAKIVTDKSYRRENSPFDLSAKNIKTKN